MLRNAYDELLEKLKDIGKAECDIKDLYIRYGDMFDEEEDEAVKVINLDNLKFEYDAGFGGQELFGYVLLKDDSWFERHEYDGAEWWEYKSVDVIKENIKNKKIPDDEY